ncbi:MAG: S-layer homology domain-containing protein [Clostridia bacterium]|nr:S-layer homology domain-containing protein [Clostridia bacterium]
MSKKTLSLLLAVLMILSSFCFTVTAADTNSKIYPSYILESQYYGYSDDFVPEHIEQNGDMYLRHTAEPGAYTNNNVVVRFQDAELVLEQYPYITIVYRTNSQSKKLDVSIRTKAGENWMAVHPDQVSDEKWNKTIVNFNDINATSALPAPGEAGIQIRFKPFGGGSKTLETKQYFDVMYIAFFKSLSEAKAYEYKLDTSALEALKSKNEERERVMNEHYFVADDEIIKRYTDEAYALIDEIVNSETSVEVTGTKYYVSPNGDDNNDGKSPESAWKTLEHVSGVKLTAGDGVFFERGKQYNGVLTMQNGITYSAYGSGAKPVINGTTDASDSLDWIPTEKENIYKYAERLESPTQDVGKIIFDNGKAWGVKVLKLPKEDKRADNAEAYNGIEYFTAGTGAFAGGLDLAYDLEFYHDPFTSEVYLYCKDGNPAERFDTVELVTKQNGLSGGKNNVLVDNLEIRGFGAHGIGVTNAVNFRVQYCVLDWIGGSVQYYNEDNRPTRYGNAIQNWTNCDGFYIDHCYSYQVFDCCYTTQWQGDSSGKSVIMTNIEFTDNVAMYANTGLEVWNSPHNEYEGAVYEVTNMTMSGNYNLYMGYGMTTDRTADKKDANLIYGGCADGGNNSTHDNVLLFSSSMIYYSATIGPDSYNFHDNTYIVNDGGLLGRISADPGKDTGGQRSVKMSAEAVADLIMSGADPGTEFYVVPADKPYAVPEYEPADELEGFDDIGDHWGRDYIRSSVRNGLFGGMSATEFAPDGTMTRAMLVTVLSRLYDASGDAQALPYSDVNKSAWYAKPLAWAYEKDIVNGGDTFRPDDSATREEMADMLYRAAKLSAKEGSGLAQLNFADSASITDAYRDAVAFCVKAGIIGGYDDNTIKPKNNATRAEVAAMIKRFDTYLGRTEPDPEKLVQRADYKMLSGEALLNAADTSYLRKTLNDDESVRFTSFSAGGNEVRPMVSIFDALISDFSIMEYPYVVIRCRISADTNLDLNIKHNGGECWSSYAPELKAGAYTNVFTDLTEYKNGNTANKLSENVMLRISPFGKRYVPVPETDLFEISSVKFFKNKTDAQAYLALNA